MHQPNLPALCLCQVLVSENTFLATGPEVSQELLSATEGLENEKAAATEKTAV